MYSKSDQGEIVTGNDRNEIIQKLFHSLLQIYQIGLED